MQDCLRSLSQTCYMTLPLNIIDTPTELRWDGFLNERGGPEYALTSFTALESLINIISESCDIKELVWSPIAAYARTVSVQILNEFEQRLTCWRNKHVELVPELDTDSALHALFIYGLKVRREKQKHSNNGSGGIGLTVSLNIGPKLNIERREMRVKKTVMKCKGGIRHIEGCSFTGSSKGTCDRVNARYTQISTAHLIFLHFSSTYLQTSTLNPNIIFTSHGRYLRSLRHAQATGVAVLEGLGPPGKPPLGKGPPGPPGNPPPLPLDTPPFSP